MTPKPRGGARRGSRVKMTRENRTLRLGAFIMATGHHIAAWRHPDARGRCRAQYRRTIAGWRRRPSAGCSICVFVADSPAGWDADKDRETRSRVSHSAHFEPVTLWAALSQVTERIGFVATASTTYEDPYLLARKFASLDHISKGRAAWNVVTTAADVSKNFSIPGHPAHANRYERAEEFVDLVLDLWDSLRGRRAGRSTRRAGVFLDPDKVHLVNHKGKVFDGRRAAQRGALAAGPAGGGAGRRVGARPRARGAHGGGDLHRQPDARRRAGVLLATSRAGSPKYGRRAERAC